MKKITTQATGGPSLAKDLIEGEEIKEGYETSLWKMLEKMLCLMALQESCCKHVKSTLFLCGIISLTVTIAIAVLGVSMEKNGQFYCATLLLRIMSLLL